MIFSAINTDDTIVSRSNDNFNKFFNYASKKS